MARGPYDDYDVPDDQDPFGVGPGPAAAELNPSAPGPADTPTDLPPWDPNPSDTGPPPPAGTPNPGSPGAPPPPAAPPPPTTPNNPAAPPPQDNMARIQAELAAVQSTDDPNYWLRVISNDPNGFGSAWDYWVDRIRRGDGSILVRNGTLTKHQEGTGTGGGSRVFSGDQGNNAAGGIIDELLKRLQGSGTFSQPAPVQGNTDPGAVALRQQILDALKTLIAQGTEPVGDVSQQPEAMAYSRAQQREQQRARSQALERRGSQGLLYSGQANTDINVGQQASAAKQAQYEATLAHNLLTDRKDRLERALTTGAGFLTNEQSQRLQEQLQNTNAALGSTDQQIKLIESLLFNQRFYDDLAYRYSTAENSANGGATR